MAGCASSLQGIAEADGVDVRRIAQPELAEHEDIRPAGDGGPEVFLWSVAGLLPRVEEKKHGVVIVIAQHSGPMIGHGPRSERLRTARCDQAAAGAVGNLRD